MSASAINATCNAVAIVDAAAIVGLYVHFNKRMNLLENTPTGIKSSGLSRSKASDEPIDVRVMTLENEITVLLQRLQVYDELFLKIMNRMKEMGPVVDRFLENGVPEGITVPSHTEAKKTTIRRRNGISLMARKEPFVDEENHPRGRGVSANAESTPVNQPDSSEDVDLDDELFSFLKD